MGIDLTTGTPLVRRASIAAVGMAAATESTVWPSETTGPISPSRMSKSWGLTARTMRSAWGTASAFEVVPRTP